MGCPCGSLDNNMLCGLDRDGDGTYTAQGITKITEMLKTNTTLTSIRCAAIPSLFGMLAAPSIECLSMCSVCSLDGNALCGIAPNGDGTYTTEGITKLADVLRTNTTLTAIRCAAMPCPFAMLPCEHVSSR